MGLLGLVPWIPKIIIPRTDTARTPETAWILEIIVILGLGMLGLARLLGMFGLL